MAVTLDPLPADEVGAFGDDAAGAYVVSADGIPVAYVVRPHGAEPTWRFYDLRHMRLTPALIAARMGKPHPFDFAVWECLRDLVHFMMAVPRLVEAGVLAREAEEHHQKAASCRP